MLQARWLKHLALVILTIATFSASNRLVADDRLGAFMKAKLLHSEKVLEGLAKGDFDLIAQHSQAINLLCEDEQWSVLKSSDYQDRTNAFQRSVRQITAAAKAKNIEAAALAYVSTTMQCVECHKFMRETKKP